MESKCTVEKTSRQVIENQLLSSLEDKSKVALLCTREDLDILISAVRLSSGNPKALSAKWQEFAADLIELRKAAFQ
jgi:hypothetical protein